MTSVLNQICCDIRIDHGELCNVWDTLRNLGVIGGDGLSLSVVKLVWKLFPRRNCDLMSEFMNGNWASKEIIVGRVYGKSSC